MIALMIRNIKINIKTFFLFILIVLISYLFYINISNRAVSFGLLVTGCANSFKNIFVSSIGISTTLLYLVFAYILENNEKNKMIQLRISLWKIHLSNLFSLFLIDMICYVFLSCFGEFPLIIFLNKFILQVFLLNIKSNLLKLIYVVILIIDFLFNMQSIFFNIMEFNQSVITGIYMICIVVLVFIYLMKGDKVNEKRNKNQSII